MYIRQTVSGIRAWNDLRQHHASELRAMESLSSGLRINRAADDAAGLAISEKMRAYIGGLEQAGKNAMDAVSLLQTAEGALSGTTSILQRMRELSVQASNGTLTEQDRAGIQKEIMQLTEAVDDLAKKTTFNTKPLLYAANSGNDYGFNGSFQIGASSGQTLSVTIKDMTAARHLKIGSYTEDSVQQGGRTAFYTSNMTETGMKVLDVSTTEKASAAISIYDDAIRNVSRERASLGAYTNRLGHIISYLGKASENLIAAESRIRDVDMAKVSMDMMQSRLRSQASLFVLNQSRSSAQSVLKLLQT